MRSVRHSAVRRDLPSGKIDTFGKTQPEVTLTMTMTRPSFDRPATLFTMYALLLLVYLMLYGSSWIEAFVVRHYHPLGASPIPSRHPRSSLFLADDDNNREERGSTSRLKDLGYTEDEIRRSSAINTDQQPQKVRVDLVDDIDSVTLTAIGFGLIAFNFLVLANLGDGGIAGVVATIINSF